jgi:hypothetical protein
MSDKPDYCPHCGHELYPIEWPIKMTVGVHGSKDGTREDIEEALEDENVNAEEWFKRNDYEAVYLANEVLMEVWLYQDGHTEVKGLYWNDEGFFPLQR